MTKRILLFCLIPVFAALTASAQVKPQAAVPRGEPVSAFHHTGAQVDSFLERIRGKLSYSWFQCAEHFRRMASEAGSQASEAGKDLGRQTRHSVEQLSDKAVKFGNESKEKAVEFGKDAAETSSRYYRKKADDVTEDIAEKTKRLEAEIRDKSSELYQDVSGRANDAAESASEKIQKK